MLDAELYTADRQCWVHAKKPTATTVFQCSTRCSTFNLEKSDGNSVFAKNGDDIRARSSHSASICFWRVQMKRSLTKPYFFAPEKSTILPFAPCEASYRTFSHPKKVRFYPSLFISRAHFDTKGPNFRGQVSKNRKSWYQRAFLWG